MRTNDDFLAYLISYPEEMAFGDEDPGAILDRYHTPDVRFVNDGVVLDRERLIAHARPARKNVVSCRVDVHDALVSGDRVSARYTVSALMRKDRTVITDIYMFGTLAHDGRIRRIHQITRSGAERS